MPRTYAHRALSEHRHFRAHRRRKDDDDRAHPFLHGRIAQDRRGPRRRGRHGLHGTGTGTRHHDHVGRDHLLLEGDGQVLPRAPHQHHRHARARRLHHRSRTLAARARLRGRAVRLRGRRAAAVGNGLAADEPLQRAAHRLRQQDGSRRRGLPARVRHDPRAPARQSRAHPAADRRRRRLRRRHRPHQDEGHLLGHGNPGHEVRVPRDSGGAACAGRGISRAR